MTLDLGGYRPPAETIASASNGISAVSWTFASLMSGSNMKLTICHVLLSFALAGAPTLAAQTSASAETPMTGTITDSPFAACVQNIAGPAQAKGIPPEVINHNLTNLSPDPDILAGPSSQPEFIKPIWDYLDATVSDTRIDTGRGKLAEWAQALDAIETTYGIDRYVVLAIWGIETSYGTVLDDPMALKPVIRSLATLACGDPNRAGFWREQLFAALQILERGDIDSDRMMGSWAGAMGHTQFMPTTYLAHAVDFDDDGRRDIWGTVPDALASTANYLKASGWRSGESWGYEVELPHGFDYTLADDTTERPFSAWAQLGVRPAQGDALPSIDGKAVLTLPAGARGPAFLLLPNFRVILQYNNSTAYALSVGHLADRLRGGPPVVRSWPRGDRTLTTSERRELQMLLERHGFTVGGLDGRIGPKTRAALRAYQHSAGLTPDGYVDGALLERLKQEQ
jgi:membrane-bound lytic murein transglycosylase B